MRFLILSLTGFALSLSGCLPDSGFKLKTELASLANEPGDSAPLPNLPAATQPIVVDGAALYGSKCQSCHGELATSTKRGRSIQQITAAIASQPLMTSTRSLSDAEVEAISTALNQVVPNPANGAQCSLTSGPAPASLQRLSRYQFLRTEQSILQSLAKMLTLKSVSTKFLSTLDAREISLSHPLVSAFSAVPNDSSANDNLYFSRNDQTVTNEMIEGYFIAITGLIDYALRTEFLPTTKIPCILGATADDVCLSDFSKSFGLKAFRRPLTSEEVATFKSVYTENGEGLSGLKALLATALLSPNHLMRLEIDGAVTSENADTIRLTPYELASKLSYTFWDDMPDDALFAAAADGSILTTSGYQTQLNRFNTITTTNFSTPEAYNNIYTLENLSKSGLPSLQLTYHLMHREWLNIDRVEGPLSNDKIFARMASTDSAPGRYAFDLNNTHVHVRAEISEFVYRHFWSENSKFSDLMTDNRVFTHAAKSGTSYWTYLGPLYGFSNSIKTDEHELALKMLPAPGYAGLLTRTALTYLGETHSNPIRRGVFIRRRILCDELPSPDFDSLPDRSLASLDSDLNSSNREKFRVKTSDAACMSCHSQINPLGFAMEDLNAVGFKLPKEYVWGIPGVNYTGTPLKELPVDASVSSLEITPGDQLPANGAAELSQQIAKSEKANQCFVKNVFRFSFGRKEQANDSCVLDYMEDQMNKNGGSIKTMVQTLATHPFFKLRKIAP